MKKQKGTTKNIIVSFLIIVVVSLSIYTYNLAGKSRVTNLRAEDLTVQVQDFKVQLQEKEQELDELNQIVLTKEQDIAGIQQDLAEIQQEMDDMRQFNKFYSKALTKFDYGAFDWYSADYNYELSDWYYNQGYFIEVIDYCVAARTLYSSANENYQKAISYFEEANKVAKGSQCKF